MRTRISVIGLALVLCVSGVLPAQAADRPENGRITFGRFDPSLGDFSLWLANSDGSHQRRLSHRPSFFSDWSPTGRRVAFDFVDAAGNVQLALIDPDGRRLRQLTTGAGIQEVPRWSPDGRWIAFDRFLPPQAVFSTSIWLIRPDGSGRHRVTRGGFDVEPVFSPDGTRIAFARIISEGPAGQRSAIFVVDRDGTHLRQVLPPRLGVEHPDWSPDGRWITFNIAPETTAAPGSGSILALHPDGTGLHVLRAADGHFRFFKPVWSPDGRRMLTGCTDVPADTDNLCTLPVAGPVVTGGAARMVVRGAPTFVNFPAWGSEPDD
jgi:Tol biopolymer transport system component